MIKEEAVVELNITNEDTQAYTPFKYDSADKSKEMPEI